MLTLDTKIDQLSKVGETTFRRLKRLGIEIIYDLIFYYPFRYDDFSASMPIDQLSPGVMATVEGRVDMMASRRTRNRRSLTEVIVVDDSGSVKIIWFNQPWISKNLKSGDSVKIFGKTTGDLYDLHFNSPEYEKVYSDSDGTGRIVPVYPTTDGLTQKQIRFLVKSVVDLISQVDDYIPESILKKTGLVSLGTALKLLHFPEQKSDIEKARKRLAFDELFLIQLWSKLLKKQLQEHESYLIKFFESETKEFVSSLGFDLTDDQRKASWEIIQDMEKSSPMNRLVEGDVGSGKTIVAAIAAYNASLNKMQSALLAPTEILASQHFTNISAILQDKMTVGLFTRTKRIINGESVSKKEFLSACAAGEIDLIIGTHAIIQDSVSFGELALVVVDEQHRFGVAQRQALKQKSNLMPHFLSLTATPIPRSLALSVYGDLDLSIIKQMPKGRKKIITKLALPDSRDQTYDFVREQVKAGRQVFVVCPLIDPSDKLGVRSVTEEFEKLKSQVFPDLAIGLVHGKLKPKDKDLAMNSFISGQTNVLVSTSVIEVGVDIGNATVMMIEGAERFGLAQLHQFRGRVGRSDHQSHCFLLTDSKNPMSVNRLNILVDCHDGFELAQYDLQHRGSGALFGYNQSGFSELKIATLNDIELSKIAIDNSKNFLEDNNLSDFPLLKAKIYSMNLAEHLE
jgi:ATP-dependent DNA helicase RecG